MIAAHPEITKPIMTSIGQPDEAGLVGRNRIWGGLYSVRFQYGAGRAYRYGAAVDDPAIIQAAGSAIRAGLATQNEDGSFPASLPDDISAGKRPGPSDKASAAAFFLRDICPSLMTTHTAPDTRAQIELATAWLAGQTEILLRRDQHAPNRLLINGLAFKSCGALVGRDDLRAEAQPFIEAAMAQYQDGIFIEAGGSDTSYQAVALVTLHDLIAVGFERPELLAAQTDGTSWLAGKITETGALDSSENTRTCRDETFMGRPKDVDLREVFLALAYTLDADDPRLIRFKKWLRRAPEPCTSN